ncbi:MAG TPA: bacteriohopanetetrol glucosamine biosynthesis glycosyltransferase HpnI [Acidobacteriaceae bacterium]|nr:bacteriohopanetetrol glucosamine biosynthesis glycosyltransferase HpnI [Acidobacteriaceae bacterium]
MKKLLDFVLGLGLFGLLTSTIYTSLAMLAVWRFIRRARRASQAVFEPPVSLLKPLHGAEPDLEAHLATFFQQDYPAYEILFCARQLDDAGLVAARRVAARYPQVTVQFLASGEPTVPNAKILSLELMAQAAHHDLLIISDSDVRVDRNYVREVVAPFSDSRVGAVTCLYRGVAGQGGAWSRIEAAAMSIEMSAGVLVADMMEGMKFALGPTMAVRRSCLKEIGGFLPMGEYCADDFLLGSWVAERGHTVVLSRHVIDHVVLHASFWPSMRHQARWMKSTRFSRPKGHLGTALTFSVPFGLLTAVALRGLHLTHGFALAGAALLWSVGTRMLLALAVSKNVLAEQSAWQSVLLYPVRDLLGIFFWTASYCSRKVLWRNEIYRLEKGGRMRRIHR